ncbi:DUF523 domain-containing protein [Coriobacteriaceae bacterium]|nr:DUF523 domain-containing protein [Coriobacteriaceae bacterium]
MDILVSNCLLGVPCRYDGGAKPVDGVIGLCSRPGVTAHPVCPECAGGLPIPRPPAEIRDGRVYLESGQDVTDEFEAGARATLETARRVRPAFCVLKAKSPSCGRVRVYDGTFSGNLVAGDGIACDLLVKEGFFVTDEKTVERCHPTMEHPVAICLGSGLGSVARLVKPVRRIPYADIDGFPAGARPVAGHSFEATVGTLDGVPVVVYPGRVHLYQGYSVREVTSLVRHAHHLGCRDIVFAAAAGAIDGQAPLGLGLVSDQLNLTGQNPLVGDEALRGVDNAFVDMSDAYTPYLRQVAKAVAGDQGVELSEGVLAGISGPSFESPAEARAMALCGASYTAMSVVNEVVLAHALGMEVLGVTLSANKAGAPGVSHETVLSYAEGHGADFEALLRGVLTRL